MFEGFPPAAFAWFDGLEADNTKAYFTATRPVYERDVRGALTALLEELQERFGGEVRVFRQQRNLRFSADRTPYKTRTYGVLAGPTLYAERLRARALRGDRLSRRSTASSSSATRRLCSTTPRGPISRRGSPRWRRRGWRSPGRA